MLFGLKNRIIVFFILVFSNFAIALTNSSSFNGAFTTEIPVVTPPFHGLEPNIKISYDSSSKSGLLGVGMSLGGLSYIERMSETRGSPKYDETDFFFLDGMKLLPCDALGGDYCTEVQNYSRIKYNSSMDRFTVTGTSGNLAIYDSAVSNSGDTFRWYLKRLQDLRGNVVNFDYQCDENQFCYLSEIFYNQTEISFHWGQRKDIINFSNGRFISQINKRLKIISIRTLGKTVRAYELKYDYGKVSEKSRLRSVQQFGNNFQLSSDGLAVISGYSLPKAEFEWQEPEKNKLFNLSKDLPNFNEDKSAWVSLRDHFVGDWNGDGKTDILQFLSNDAPRSWTALSQVDSENSSFDIKNNLPVSNTANSAFLDTNRNILRGDWNGDGRTDLFHLHPLNPKPSHSWVALATDQGNFDFMNTLPGSSPFTASHYSTKYKQILVGDWNGDGLHDLLNLYPNCDPKFSWVALSKGDGEFNFQKSLPGACLERKSYLGTAPGYINYQILVGDWNGDGLSDILHLHPTKEKNKSWVGISNGDGSFTFKHSLPGSCLDKASYLNAKHPSIKVGDFNGDGKSDLLYIHPDANPAHSWVALSKGNGTFEFSNSLPGSSFANKSFLDAPHNKVYVLDLNGDKISDLVHVHPNKEAKFSWYAIARGDGTFRFENIDQSKLSSLFLPANNTNLLIGDFDGNGTDDFMHLDNGGAKSRSWMTLSSGLNQDLLVSVKNGTGATSFVEYEASSSWSNINLPLNFVVPTVKAITIDDGRGNSYRNEFFYEGGRYSKKERRFLGFRKITQILNEDGDYQESFFLQKIGSLNKPELIRISNSEGKIYKYEKFEYVENKAPPYSSLLSNKWDYICNLTEQCEKKLNQFSYDAYGNVAQVLQYGNIDFEGDERTIQRRYVPNNEEYIVGLPAEEFTFEGIGENKKLISAVRYFYDSSTDHLNFPRFGNISSTAKWLSSNDTWLQVKSKFDEFGNIIEHTDENGRVTRSSFDKTLNIYPISQCNSLDHCIKQKWDYSLGLIIEKTDENGSLSKISYDSLGRKKHEISARNAKTIFSYHHTGDPKKQYTYKSIADQSPEGIWMKTFQDGFGRVYKIEKKTGLTKKFTFADASSNISAKSNWHNESDTAEWSRFTFDTLKRPLKNIHPDESFSTTQYTMDRQSRPIEIHRDELGKFRIIWKDSFGRLSQVSEQVQGSFIYTTYAYNSYGLLSAVVDAKGTASYFSWDSLGRKLSSCDQNNSCYFYEYNSGGQIIKQKDPQGDELRFSYDPLGRKKEKILADGTKYTWSYDNNQLGNGIGRLSSTKSPKNKEKYYWNDLGLLKKSTVCIENKCRDFSFEYDLIGRLKYLIYPDGEKVPQSYDDLGRPKSLGRYLISANYDEQNQLLELLHGNKVNELFEYDKKRGWLTHSTLESNSDTKETFLTRNKKGFIQTKNSAYGVNNYEYDDLGRLTKVDGPGSQSLSYDILGNIFYNSRSGEYYYEDSDNPNRLTRIDQNVLTYNKNGYTVSKGEQTLQWNSEHKLVSVRSQNSKTKFSYNATGQRIIKSQGENKNIFYFSKYWKEENDQIEKSYFLGDRLIAKRRGNNTVWTHFDHLGSLSYLTNRAGDIAQAFEYDAFGSKISSLNANEKAELAYTGHIQDEESGLIYMKARYYDPFQGRFISPDSIIPDVSKSQALNRYAYVYNNPLAYTDPSGHAPAVAAIATATAVAIGGSSTFIAATAIIGAGVTSLGYFTKNPSLMTLGSVMLGFAAAPSLAGGLSNGAVAFATSTHSPLNPKLKKILGWGYLAYGFIAKPNSVLPEDNPELGSLLKETHEQIKAGHSISDKLVQELSEATGLRVDEWQSFFDRIPDMRKNPLLKEGLASAPISNNSFWGSGSQLLYGKLVSKSLGLAGKSLNSYQAILLNPSGGLVGPGASAFYIPSGALGLHSVIHDADGFLHNAFGLGNGYSAWPHPGFFPGSPLSGQIGGLFFQTLRNTGGLTPL